MEVLNITPVLDLAGIVVVTPTTTYFDCVDPDDVYADVYKVPNADVVAFCIAVDMELVDSKLICNSIKTVDDTVKDCYITHENITVLAAAAKICTEEQALVLMQKHRTEIDLMLVKRKIDAVDHYLQLNASTEVLKELIVRGDIRNAKLYDYSTDNDLSELAHRVLEIRGEVE